MTSFIGVAPISDPQLVVLVTLYNPTGEGGHQGGAVGAPVGGKVLSEILPYLELQKDNVNEEDLKQEVEVPKIEGMIIEEAINVLKKYGLEMQIENKSEEFDKKTTIIQEQIPKQGIKVYEGTKIIVKI